MPSAGVLTDEPPAHVQLVSLKQHRRCAPGHNRRVRACGPGSCMQRCLNPEPLPMRPPTPVRHTRMSLPSLPNRTARAGGTTNQCLDDWCQYSLIEAVGVTVFNNSGAPAVNSDGSNVLIVLSGCTIVGNNNSLGDGGGVFFDSPTQALVIRDTVIQNNTAVLGGAVAIQRAHSVDMQNVTMVGNTALGDGGGLAFAPDSPARSLHTCVNGVTMQLEEIYGNIAAATPGQNVPLVAEECAWQIAPPPGCVTELTITDLASVSEDTNQIVVTDTATNATLWTTDTSRDVPPPILSTGDSGLLVTFVNNPVDGTVYATGFTAGFRAFCPDDDGTGQVGRLGPADGRSVPACLINSSCLSSPCLILVSPTAMRVAGGDGPRPNQSGQPAAARQLRSRRWRRRIHPSNPGVRGKRRGAHLADKLEPLGQLLRRRRGCARD